jgi:hypothetical protein
VYEAVVAGLPSRRSLVGEINGLKELPGAEGGAYHWPLVANAAVATVMRGLYGGRTVRAVPNLARIDALESELAAAAGVVLADTRARSAQFGARLGAAIVRHAESDGGHEGYLRNDPVTYAPPTGEGLWRPTPPTMRRALQPLWGNNRPFVLRAGAACEPGPPFAYSTDPASPFYADAVEVLETLGKITPDRLRMIGFWADEPARTATPAGHSISIATQVLTMTGAPLDVAAETYARVGMAAADAFIATWSAKYRYNVVRPITYMIDVLKPRTAAVPLMTPPFPEYPSGHAVQSAAAAEVLTGLFGELPFTDRTHEGRGLGTRSFASFHDAAREAAMSRLFGGIHFRKAIEAGLAQGRCVGAKVNALPFER